MKNVHYSKRKACTKAHEKHALEHTKNMQESAAGKEFAHDFRHNLPHHPLNSRNNQNKYRYCSWRRAARNLRDNLPRHPLFLVALHNLCVILPATSTTAAPPQRPNAERRRHLPRHTLCPFALAPLSYRIRHMGWPHILDSLNSYVSFTKKPRFYWAFLPKRPRALLPKRPSNLYTYHAIHFALSRSLSLDME